MEYFIIGMFLAFFGMQVLEVIVKSKCQIDYSKIPYIQPPQESYSLECDANGKWIARRWVDDVHLCEMDMFETLEEAEQQIEEWKMEKSIEK